MVVEIGLTPVEKQLVFERLGKIAKGNQEWDKFIDANSDITKAWNKFMNAIFGENWEREVKDMVL